MANQRRGPWSQAEDKYLMTLVQSQGALNWVRISQLLNSRTPKQCRERYHQNLKPSLNHEPITPEEGILIENLVETIGKRWAEIARRLHNRSDNAVKNWWNGSMNRRRRMVRRKAPGSSMYEDSHMTTAYSQAPPAPLRLPTTQQYSQYAQYPQYTSLSSPSSTTNRYSHAGWPVQSGLPSPSTTSPGGESILEAAPSLMSDNGSSYSTSPTSGRLPLPESPIELPPLRLSQSLSSQSQGSPPLPSLSKRQDQYTLPPIQDYVKRQQLPTAPNSPTEESQSLPLSPFGSHDSKAEDSARDKDSRMKVNSLLL